MKKIKRASLILAAAFVFAALAGCGGGEPEEGDSGGPDESGGGSGTLEVRADGEERAREGLETKDGWAISFDDVLVTLSDVAAYQSDPPYNPDDGEDVEASEEVAVEGVHTVNLAEEGEGDADSVEVGTAEEAPEGLYNALSWRMTPAEDGDAEGASLLMNGTAEKDGESIDFSISITEEYEYLCGEFVGDERKGILEGDGGEADLEATFHFDHLFGDGGSPPDDEINTGAVGFDPFAEMAEDGSLEADLGEFEESLPPEDFELLASELPTLGHTGEGHCLETNSGATG